MRGSKHDILERWERNPIITLADIPYPCNTVFNGAVTKFKDDYIMLLRVEGLHGGSVIVPARSADGYHFSVSDKAAIEPSQEEAYKEYEEHGVEDPRIIQFDGKYYVMYTAASRFGPRIALAETKDFNTYKRIGYTSVAGNKNGLLFPRKIKGRYAQLERPIAGDLGNIWISYSKDLIHWGDAEMVARIRWGHWDSYRIGGSVPPIETKKGWLEIYHGVKMTSSGPIYRLGTLLLDLHDPSKVIGRSKAPILSPCERYERVGDINNVVFSCGAVVEDDGMVKVYYGAADTSICLAFAHIDELIAACDPVTEDQVVMH